MINVDGDSSEEDEIIDGSNSVVKETETFADHLPEQSTLRKTVLLEPLADEEEEDEEDAPLPIISIATDTSKESEGILTEKSEAVVAQSEECAEALQAIESDAWDVNSWILFVEEVAEGRGGTISIEDSYCKFLDKFPRAARFWKDLAEHHTKNGATSSAQEVYSKSLNKCFSVELWQSYIEFIRQTSKGRKVLEDAFERAVESVGMSVDSYPLWRSFIDLQQELPDSDPGGKLSALRKVYQRAVSVPMDSLDIIWKEYETLEKQAGEHLAEKVLPEYNEKYLHAKAIYRDRKRLVAKIDTDRPAIPPTNSIIELQQLDNWNRWIKYEMTNPDNLDAKHHAAMMKFVYGQCICAFLFNPEVWMSFAQYLLHSKGVPDARAVYREAIDVIPNVVSLRVALAELEEAHGSKDNARITLRSAFEKLPSAYTFSTFQRFVRRKDGMSAARKIFSETMPLRKDPTKESLGLEICMAHAQLELDVNINPDVASRVLEMARVSYPTAASDVRFVRMLARVLVRMGDLRQIRWIFQTALGDAALGVGATALIIGDTAAAGAIAAGSSGGGGGGGGSGAQPAISNLVTSGIPELAAGPGGSSRHSRHQTSAAGDTTAGTGTGAGGGRSLKDLLDLWEEYLAAETVLGLSDIARLDELRDCRDKARATYENSERAKQAGIVIGTSAAEALNAEAAAARVKGLFEYATELGERYDSLGAFAADGPDALLRQRSKGKRFLEEVSRQESDRMNALREAGTRRWRRDRTEEAAEAGPAHLSGVPNVVREFLPKLPAHSGAIPDIEGFMRQLRTIVLPPRPAGDGEGEFGSAGGKRGREEEGGSSVSGAADWMQSAETKTAEGEGGDGDGDNEDADAMDVVTGARDDVFRQRQRLRLGL